MKLEEKLKKHIKWVKNPTGVQELLEETKDAELTDTQLIYNAFLEDVHHISPYIFDSEALTLKEKAHYQREMYIYLKDEDPMVKTIDMPCYCLRDTEEQV